MDYVSFFNIAAVYNMSILLATTVAATDLAVCLLLKNGIQHKNWEQKQSKYRNIG